MPVTTAPATVAPDPTPATAGGSVGAATDTAEPYDIAGWATVLATYVTDDGGFRYAALKANPEHVALLDRFVTTVGTADPSGWSRDQQLAFYINAYNALVIKSVLAKFPLDSVMSSPGFFDQEKHRVAGQELTLNQLENDTIRSARFAEPRIHFLVNCASVGCPRLIDHPITAGSLERDLAAQAEEYIRRTTRVNRAQNRIETSKIFEWFAADFAAQGGPRAFVASRLAGEDAAFARSESTQMQHFEYDWALNKRD